MQSFLKLKEVTNITDCYEFSGRDKLGEGAYGIVYKAQRKDTKTVCALKTIKKSSLDKTDYDCMMKELEIL